MSETPAGTIKAAAEAYLAGDRDALEALLHEDVHVLGSEEGEDWGSRTTVRANLGPELKRIREGQAVEGGLVDLTHELDPAEVEERGDIAWWSVTGNMVLGDTYHSQTSWTVVLRREGDGWQIVHSHFSIHR